MFELRRREFLASLPLLSSFRLQADAALQAEAAGISVGYAAITWGGDDVKAIEEIADVGFKGIQLRNTVLDRFAERPGDLKAMLAQRGLTFAVMSSGNLKYDAAS